MYRWGTEEIAAATSVLESGELFRYHDDSRAASFEAAFGTALGHTHVLAVHSGTAALIAALMACEIGPGDEVIVPGFTFIATAAAPVAVGAVPVIAEIDESLSLDPDALQSRLSDRTRAVIAVHMLGAPADLDAIRRAVGPDVVIVEDCAQACGATYRGAPVGSIGAVGTFSFNYAKTLSCGEGGAVTTADSRLFDRLKMAHDPGSLWREPGRRYDDDDFPGLGMRIDELRAAIMEVQLSRLPEILSNLRRVKESVRARLADAPNLSFRKLNDPAGDTGTSLVVFLPDRATAERFVTALGARGVRPGTEFAAGLGRQHTTGHTLYSPDRPDRHIYPFWTYIMNKGTHKQNACSYACPRYGRRIDFSVDMCPQTIQLLERGANIGINPDWTDGDIERVADAVRGAACEVAAG
jgi:8-amino-3,8-dideoxy-alpha-D-manno-octulosonate transaminase